MKKRFITASKAHKTELLLAVFLLIVTYILYITVNITAVDDDWHVCAYVFFLTFVAAVSTSCIALSGFIYAFLKSTGVQ